MPRIDCASFRLALIVALAAAIGLAGCGRRGPLDPPPAAVSAPPAQGTTTAQAQGKPVAPQGQRKSFFLDWLLN